MPPIRPLCASGAWLVGGERAGGALISHVPFVLNGDGAADAKVQAGTKAAMAACDDAGTQGIAAMIAVPNG